jgi:hypothetical protein
MIFSFTDDHCAMSAGSGFDGDLDRCTWEATEAFFECFRAGTPFFTLVESPKGIEEYMYVLGEGIDLCFSAGEIHLSSGRGLRTGLEGGVESPFVTPVEEDRVGMALGEAGFSPSIWGTYSYHIKVKSRLAGFGSYVKPDFHM